MVTVSPQIGNLTHYRRHEELDVPLLEIADDVRGEERPVQVEALDFDALAADETEASSRILSLPSEFLTNASATVTLRPERIV